jgi:hypothetical protein
MFSKRYCPRTGPNVEDVLWSSMNWRENGPISQCLEAKSVLYQQAVFLFSSSLIFKLIRSGNRIDKPQKGEEVTVEYTGWLYDASEAANQYRGVE